MVIIILEIKVKIGDLMLRNKTPSQVSTADYR